MSVIDEVHYALPFGLLGEVARSVEVARRPQRIFDYWAEALERTFARVAGDPAPFMPPA